MLQANGKERFELVPSGSSVSNRPHFTFSMFYMTVIRRPRNLGLKSGQAVRFSPYLYSYRRKFRVVLELYLSNVCEFQDRDGSGIYKQGEIPPHIQHIAGNPLVGLSSSWMSPSYVTQTGLMPGLTLTKTLFLWILLGYQEFVFSKEYISSF